MKLESMANLSIRCVFSKQVRGFSRTVQKQHSSIELDAASGPNIMSD
jgi:hypothetical protein